MHIIYFLVPVGIVLMLLAAWGFYYAVKTQQFDDLTGDAERILLDDRQLMRRIAQSQSDTSKVNSDTDTDTDTLKS